MAELKSLLGRLISSFANNYENKFNSLLLLKDVVGDTGGNSNEPSWVEKQFRCFFECGVYFLNDLFGVGFGRQEENMVAFNLFSEQCKQLISTMKNSKDSWYAISGNIGDKDFNRLNTVFAIPNNLQSFRDLTI